jgi:transcriptional regulatory protein LevR
MQKMYKLEGSTLYTLQFHLTHSIIRLSQQDCQSVQDNRNIRQKEMQMK